MLGRAIAAAGIEQHAEEQRPQGKTDITGYNYEPWHYRYIGVADAKRFGANTNLTLEEYLGIA